MIKIIDELGVISGSQKENLASEAGSWPFEVTLLVTNNATASLDARTGSLVDSPNTVSIGVSPGARKVYVHFGTGTGIPSSKWDEIITAGNAEFKKGNWSEGVGDIALAAKESRQQAETLQPGKESAPENTSNTVWFVGGFVLFLVLMVGAIAAMKDSRRRRQEASLDSGFPRQTFPPRPAYKPYTSLAPRSIGSSPRPTPAPTTPVSDDNHLMTGVILGSVLSSSSAPAAPAPEPAPAPKPSHSYESSSPSPSSSSYDPSPSYTPFDAGGGGGGFGGGGFDGGGGGSSF